MEEVYIMLELKDREWTEFKVGELFSLKVAKSNDKGKLNTGNIPFIGRSNDNNGLQGFFDAPNVTKGQCITLGMVGTFRAFWQEEDFAASQNILTLRAYWLNRHTALFVCNIIETAIKGRYSYGNSIKAGTFGDTTLNLPIDCNCQPDYEFMEQYIKEREPDYSWATGCIEPNAEMSLQDREWAEFRVDQIFIQERGKEKAPKQNGDGDIPLIVETESNNGVLKNAAPTKVFDGNAITVSINVPKNVFYQEKDFCASVNIAILRNDYINKYSGLFIANLISYANRKYNYGNKQSKDRLNATIISLPVNTDGQPDYEFMEQYIKSLSFSKVLE